MKSKFYKTTRLDGGSWHDSNFVYEEGRTYRPARGTTADSYSICTKRVLHACDTPGKAAMGSWGTYWPFLLWSFEGTPVVAGWDKYGFRQVGPMVKEDPGLCFGPNGARVVALLRVLEAATRPQVEALSARGKALNTVGWSAEDVATHDAAKNAVWWAGVDARRDTIQNFAGGAVGHTAWSSRWAVTYVSREAAVQAGEVAVSALVVADLVGQHRLEQHHVDWLLAPIVEAFGADWMKE